MINRLTVRPAVRALTEGTLRIDTMTLHPLTVPVDDTAALTDEYKEARQIGVIRIGQTCLFFRVRMKTYYIPYSEVTRCFRRVMLVPARMCCGRGDLSIENLVICGGADENGQEKELAQIELPGDKAAKILMEELKQKMPGIPFVCPPKAEPAN